MNLADPLNKETVIIKTINIIKDAQTIGASNTSSIHILNTDNNNDRLLKNYIKDLRINDLPNDFYTTRRGYYGENKNSYLDDKIKDLPYTTPKLLLISQKNAPTSEYFTIEFYYTK